MSCALLTTGHIDCWGANYFGQLGSGSITESGTPVEVAGVNNATHISTGGEHACAVLSTGQTDCWGLNDYGQLGDGTTTNSSIPVQVQAISTASSLTTGRYDTCVLLATGHIACWGLNSYGQLGNGTTTNSDVPGEVPGVSSATQVSAGGFPEHACALLSTGPVDCWGYNGDGELGEPNEIDAHTPVQVIHINDATRIAAGQTHTCAILSGGTVDCWGLNLNGQLGDGTAWSTVPTEPLAPSPPGVVTGSPGSVTATSATLKATVNPATWNVTSCEFEYGGTSEYGSSVPCSSLPGAGATPVEVSAPVSGLAAGSSYHFRIVATSGAGTSYGGDQTLTTPPDPPSVVTGAASPVTQTSATLNATVNPNGATVSDCHFEYGESPSYGSSLPCSSLPGAGTDPVAVATAITGLAPGTTYHFRIAATNPGGTNYGSDRTFATRPEAPSVVTRTASLVTQTSATLNATVNPNGATVSDCHFEYGESPSYGSSLPCSSLPGAGTNPVAVATAITGLAPGTPYHFRIAATNPEGTSYGSDETLATQPEGEQEEPIREREEEALKAEEEEEEARAELEGYGRFVIEGYEPGIGLLSVRNPPGTTIEALSDQAIDEAGLPAGSLAVVGGVSYSLSGLPAGTSVDVKFELPAGSNPTSVFKFTKGKWEDVTHLATITGDTITFHVRDGGEGDEDGIANGVIVDPLVPVRLASPPPRAEVGRCTPAPTSKEGSKAVYGGDYGNVKCSKAVAGGRYRWKAGAAQTGFTASGSKMSVETPSRVKVSCKASSATGEVTGQTGENIQIEFSGCSGAGGTACTTQGQQTGVILSSLLGGSVGFLDAAKGAVGIDLAPVNSSSPNVAEFDCGATPERLAGSFVGQLTTVGKMSSSLQLQFKGKHGTQTNERLEGEPVEALSLSSGAPEAAHTEPADLSTKLTQRHTEPIEIKNKP